MNFFEPIISCDSYLISTSSAVFTGSIAASALMIAFGTNVIKSYISFLVDQPSIIIPTNDLKKLIIFKNLSTLSFLASNFTVIIYWVFNNYLILEFSLLVFLIGIFGLLVLFFTQVTMEKKKLESIEEYNKKHLDKR